MARKDMVRGLELEKLGSMFSSLNADGCKNHRLFHAICYLFEKLKGVFASIMVQWVLLFKTISCKHIETVSSMVRGLKLDVFKFKCYACNNHWKNYYGYCSMMKFVWYLLSITFQCFFITLQKHQLYPYGYKGTDFSIELI